VALTNDLELGEPDCWISPRVAESSCCAVSITGALNADAARLVRRWVVLLRDVACGEVTIHCEALRDVDDHGRALLQELVWGLEAQGRRVYLDAVPDHLQPRLLGLTEVSRTTT
jgi:ABC-type transporter Mla MlaB component